MVGLDTLTSGEHFIVVDLIAAASLWPGMSELPLERAFALFMRLALENGETLRIGGTSNWKTSVVRNDDWYEPGYDDTAWGAARPAAITHQPWPPQPARHLR